MATFPVWGATPCGVRRYLHFLLTEPSIISIHAPRVGCDGTPVYLTGDLAISIHAPRVGCDYNRPVQLFLFTDFQSTHPVWGATRGGHGAGTGPLISIHAPRVGCDVEAINLTVNKYLFQSTHPVWGATDPMYVGLYVRADFDPRTPCGVRQQIYTRYEVNRCVPCTDYTV